MKLLLSLFVVGVVAFGVGTRDGTALLAQEPHAEHAATPLDRDIGRVTMQISCAEPARSPFARGLALLHSFAWEDARAQFRAAASADAACAMAYWGEAMTYYDGLHNPPSDQGVAAARAALAKARQARAQSERERAYITALQALLDRYDTATRKEHDAAYSQALKAITERYPTDVEANAFYALSLLTLARRGAANAYDLQMNAARILEPLFKTHPDQPGVAHYLIHAYDDSVHDLLVRYYLDTDRPAEAAEMPFLTDQPLQKAEALLVRGLGQARAGKLDAADASLDEMRQIMAQIKDVDVDVRARIVDVQAKQLEATLLLARKQTEAALTLLEETVRIEDAPGVSWAQTPGRHQSIEGLARAQAAPATARTR